MKSIALALVLFAAPVLAHDRTEKECTEAAEMVLHTAQSRDTGHATRASIMADFAADLISIQQFPPASRWFVEDEDDAQLLYKGVLKVFDEPGSPPEQLQSDFKAECIGGKSL